MRRTDAARPAQGNGAPRNLTKETEQAMKQRRTMGVLLEDTRVMVWSEFLELKPQTRQAPSFPARDFGAGPGGLPSDASCLSSRPAISAFPSFTATVEFYVTRSEVRSKSIYLPVHSAMSQSSKAMAIINAGYTTIRDSTP
jgi:hypothetical protein